MPSVVAKFRHYLAAPLPGQALGAGDGSTTPPRAPNNEHHFREYELLFLRNVEKDVQLWDAPALGLAAQAFLFTISLDSGASELARQIASGLTVLVAIITMQLMAKHRFYIRVDEAYMEQLENDGKVSMRLMGRPWMWEHPPKKKSWQRRPRRRLAFTGIKQRSLTRWSSFVVWQVGLALIGFAGTAIFAISLVKPSLLE